ncbi:TolC family protein [Parabacteroides sp.]
MKKIIISILTAAIISSCGTYTHYKRPDNVSTAELYREDSLLHEDTTSIVSLSWRKLFTDPALQRLIGEALQSNTDLRIARLKVDEAQASLTSARLAFLPSVSLNPQGSLSSFDGAKTAKTYSLGASASWEIDVFGRLRNAKEQSKARLEQSRNYRQAVQSQLVTTVSEYYYTLLMLDEQIHISERTQTYWEENVRTTKALKQAGKTDEQAVAQSEANLLAIRSSLVTLKEQLATTENSFCALLGQTPHSIERGLLSEQQFPEELSVGLPIDLLSNRPDVRQAENVLKEYFYATNEARSAFYPSITLGGSAGWTNSSGMAIVNPGKWLLNTIGTLVQPIFQKGTNIARLKIAKARQEEALLSFQQSLLDAGTEVNNALTGWQSARQRKDFDQKQIEFLRQALRSAELTMRHGHTTYLEVLTAQQSLLQAELVATSSRFDEIEGIVNLYHALGGGID